MSGGQGFEFTPGGIVPLGAYRAQGPTEDVAGATADVPRPEASTGAPAARLEATPRIVGDLLAIGAVKPRDVVKLARTRVRELDREIKRLEGLKKEREELRRLLAAAKAAPKTNVRAIARTA